MLYKYFSSFTCIHKEIWLLDCNIFKRMKLLFFTILFFSYSGVLFSETFSRSSSFTIGGDGISLSTPSGAPIQINRQNNGDLSANFSIMKMLSGGENENLQPLPQVVIPPKTDTFTDSDTFFKGIGSKAESPESERRPRSGIR